MVPVLVHNTHWMTWNLFLAVIPAALAVVLFRPGTPHTPRWWCGVAVFAAFLPNAAYVLTDVIHLQEQVSPSTTDRAAAALLVQYGMFVSAGFLAYVLAVVRLERWLRAQGWSRLGLVVADLTVHGACAVGVFLGRIFRFNSWDLVVRPDDILAVMRVPGPWAQQALTFMFVTLLVGTLLTRVAAAGALRLVRLRA